MLDRPLVPYTNRIYFFLITILTCAVLFYHLVSIQIVKGSQYYFDSKNLSLILPGVDRANRGLIYDRNGILLVDNVSKYKVSILKKDETTETKFNKTVENLSKLFNQNIQERYDKEYLKVKDYKVIPEVKLFTNLDYNPYIFQINANPDNFPAIRLEKVNVRKYLYPELTSHIIGYTGEITREDYETGKYNYGDQIGKFGVERSYDDILRGKNGIRRTDAYISEGTNVTSTIQPKVNGQDIYLTIDINYQRKLYESIKLALTKPSMKDTTSVAAVVEDVKTGQILALGSYPNFDANLFAQGIKQEDYEKYLNDPGNPLANKALQYAQAPGSIFKTITDMVSLQNGAISKNTKFSTGGTWKYGNITFQDAGRKNWGEVNVVQGICVSSNIFHMKTALALNEKTNGRAAELIGEKFSEIGLDQRSPLNIGGEAIGYFPTPKDKEEKGQVWLPGYLLNSSIGQGEVKVTPLGAASLATTIANKGVVKKQSIILDREKSNVVEEKSLNIDPAHYDTIREGMTCAARKDNPIGKYDPAKYSEVSEKTGTAETGQIKNGQEVIHGWEITFTPSEKPEIAMSVFLENGNGGYKSAYISREFYKAWNTELRTVNN